MAAVYLNQQQTNSTYLNPNYTAKFRQWTYESSDQTVCNALGACLNSIDSSPHAGSVVTASSKPSPVPATAAKASKTIAPWEIGSWILENFATVDEVRKNIGSIVVPEVVLKEMGFAPPVHYAIHDASGKSIVIEYIEGKLRVYDNPLGVLTNSPSFDWQMTNLRNYVNFSLVNVPPVHLGSVTLQGFVQGTGMLGLPGDLTPPARFVRAVAYTHSVFPSKTGDETVLQAFHILNNFDIPRGSPRDDQKDQYGNIIADYTLWTSASDLKARRYYFRTSENSQIRSVDLMKMPIDAKDITRISMKGNEVIKSMSP